MLASDTHAIGSPLPPAPRALSTMSATVCTSACGTDSKTVSATNGACLRT